MVFGSVGVPGVSSFNWCQLMHPVDSLSGSWTRWCWCALVGCGPRLCGIESSSIILSINVIVQVVSWCRLQLVGCGCRPVGVQLDRCSSLRTQFPDLADCAQVRVVSYQLTQSIHQRRCSWCAQVWLSSDETQTTYVQPRRYMLSAQSSVQSIIRIPRPCRSQTLDRWLSS